MEKKRNEARDVPIDPHKELVDIAFECVMARIMQQAISSDQVKRLERAYQSLFGMVRAGVYEKDVRAVDEHLAIAKKVLQQVRTGDQSVVGEDEMGLVTPESMIWDEEALLGKEVDVVRLGDHGGVLGTRYLNRLAAIYKQRLTAVGDRGQGVPGPDVGAWQIDAKHLFHVQGVGTVAPVFQVFRITDPDDDLLGEDHDHDDVYELGTFVDWVKLPGGLRVKPTERLGKITDVTSGRKEGMVAIRTDKGYEMKNVFYEEGDEGVSVDWLGNGDD
jgi:hypothetical protein